MTRREQNSGAGQQEGPEAVERKGWAVEPEEPRPPHGRQGPDRDEAADLPAFDFAAAWGGPPPLVRDLRDDLSRGLDDEQDGERARTSRSTDDTPSGATSDVVGEVFEVEDTSWLLVPPPVRAATSLEYLPDLPAGTSVALRHPGGGFLPDLVLTKSSTEVRATSAPVDQGQEPQESRHALVTSEAHWAVHRYLRDCTWYQRWAPARDLFVYSDLPPSAATADLASSEANDRTEWVDGRAGGAAVRRHWAQELDRDPSLPPAQRPAPARESGSLLGRRLRFQARPGDWQWVIASSEPYSGEHGAIVVRVVSITTWHLWHAHSFDNDGAVLTLPLERAWVY